ncbi:SRPBCC family protein [Halobacterium rubrum]|uniref:SRPBCC family protein n=1 Tax=Halobacterium TaxID=2239 RepID=UPI001F41BC05|nr:MULTISPECIES: SRPBCC family protein [Halobacterium]MDH5021134.1 SRPBCC family protein [Halobacterium rubrum]
MQTVTVERTVDAQPASVRDALGRLEPFVEASGFDEVAVDGDTVEVGNQVGIMTLELTLEVVDDPDADLAYVQTEGLFDEMSTTYTVDPAMGGDASVVTATTDFSLDVPVLGDVLDATVIKRQRRKELESQFDWLQQQAAGSGADESTVK